MAKSRGQFGVLPVFSAPCVFVRGMLCKPACPRPAGGYQEATNRVPSAAGAENARWPSQYNKRYVNSKVGVATGCHNSSRHLSLTTSVPYLLNQLIRILRAFLNPGGDYVHS